MAEADPVELDVLNAGLPTLQMNQISVSPFSPTDDALAGTQDNGTIALQRLAHLVPAAHR